MIAPVISTPKVASADAGFQTSLMALNGVCRPPSNKINANASVPKEWAASALSNKIPPGPSSPANIPTSKKSTNTGKPRRADNLLEMIPSKINTAASNIIWSIKNIYHSIDNKGEAEFILHYMYST